MKIPRIRILRTWQNAKTGMRGHWLLLVEPRWPTPKFTSFEERETFVFLRLKQTSTLDFIVEHFDRNAKTMGDCKETVWAIDLEDLLWWRK